MERLAKINIKGSAPNRQIHPYVKLTLRNAQFCINPKGAECIGIYAGDAVMFSLNRKEKCAYIYKEEPAADNYSLSRPNHEGGDLRFMNRNLKEILEEFFEVEDVAILFLRIHPTPDEHKRYKVSLFESNE